MWITLCNQIGKHWRHWRYFQKCDNANKELSDRIVGYWRHWRLVKTLSMMGSLELITGSLSMSVFSKQVVPLKCTRYLLAALALCRKSDNTKIYKLCDKLTQRVNHTRTFKSLIYWAKQIMCICTHNSLMKNNHYTILKY